MNERELKHYGIPGMKWGVRRATYKIKSANSLEKGKKKIKRDITKLERKVNNQMKKTSDYQAIASRKLKKGNTSKAAKYINKSSKSMRKAQKRGKTIIHNKKLLELYDSRISELTNKRGKTYVDSIIKTK